MKSHTRRWFHQGVAVTLVTASITAFTALAADNVSQHENTAGNQYRVQTQKDSVRDHQEAIKMAETQSRERIRSGEDNTQGQGERYRERVREQQSENARYGSGYESRQRDINNGNSAHNIGKSGRRH